MRRSGIMRNSADIDPIHTNRSELVNW